jgi:hypothetical protein
MHCFAKRIYLPSAGTVQAVFSPILFIHIRKENIMGMGFDLGRILDQYSGGPNAQQSQQVERDFDDIAQNAPPEELSQGLTEAFRSDQTAPFGDMISQLFGQADTQQRTGMLNQLLSGVGPSLLASVLGGSALGGLLNRAGGHEVQLRPEEVEQLTPQQVRDIASQAEKENPGIIERMSGFYAQNPALVKSLGGAALAIALGKMSQRSRGK